MKKYTIKEHETTDLYQFFADEFDGQWDGERLHVNHEDVKIDITYYEDIFGVSVGINEVSFKEDTIISIEQDLAPLLIVRFIINSEFNLPQRDNISVGPNHLNGVLLSNTETPIEIKLLKGEVIRWIAVRVRIEDWVKIVNGRFTQLDQLFKSKEPWVIAKPVTTLMEKNLHEILALREKDYGHRVLSIAKAIELLALLFTQLIKEDEQGEELGLLQEDYEVILEIKKLLEKDYVNPPKIEELSKMFAQSVTKLRQNFKKVTGLPIHQFVMKERYAEAYKRIINSKDAITEIALDLGFSNSAHFSDGFKKQFSISPSKLRSEMPD
ncbi:helix-turn-helix transcriptional regulator [Flammeovirga aprica]|uniref:Helix-turn-helix transcriptional regulator n=1 Tax=Flammeovirga aprica JL-4 TaxID=694437 RepID=A0A7X9XAA1_9BACT|nr:AraC family transcriptional regulator [Flammeovirga aprica]NME69460.1 helix-turn-helix transcriptional regulator [Flammeovirga aprica JL-4]